MNYFWVAIGGAIGASLRYAVMNVCITLRLISFPFATLTVNILGSFLIGLLSFYFLYRFTDNSTLRLFFIVGILGAFTTFSAFSLDTINLFMQHRYVAAISYILASVILCLLAALAGMLIINKLR